MPKNPQMVKLGRQSRDLRIARTGTAMPPAVAALGRTAYWNKIVAEIDPDNTLPPPEQKRRARALWAARMRAAREGWKQKR
jgi:hypothetical protein